MKDKCPHCGKTNCVKEVCFNNVENYGSSSFHLPCLHCGKMIRVSLSRVVKLNYVEESPLPRDESDF
jgi:hypothetical protein